MWESSLRHGWESAARADESLACNPTTRWSDPECEGFPHATQLLSGPEDVPCRPAEGRLLAQPPSAPRGATALKWLAEHTGACLAPDRPCGWDTAPASLCPPPSSVKWADFISVL